ncbi:uncharacterized protein L201_003556 [Kwoniella dendrophila CBS 6074]|uniref:Mutanase n=1 Tax=Kwoniella dendrophila CBS 6074 TaxID=1295534 RepID=A0AAX4JV28_9TREE
MKLVAAFALLQVLPAVLGKKHGDSFERRSRNARHGSLAERQVIETIFETNTVWVDALPTDSTDEDETVQPTTKVEVAALAAPTEDVTSSASSAAPSTIETASQALNPIDTFVSSDSAVTSASASTSSSAATASAGTELNATISANLNVTDSDDEAMSSKVSAKFGDSSASSWWGNWGGIGKKPSNGEKSNRDKKVFAHFMIGIVYSYSLENWIEDINLAKSKGIDGFALNIGLDWYTQPQLDLAYKAAEQVGNFDCFISFDFNWYTTTNVSGVSEMMARYNNLPAQLKVDNKPFVSSFIGDGFNWSAVATSLNQEIYAVPFWAPTQDNANNAGLSGLFSWTAWASKDNGPIDEPLTTKQDEAYIDVVTKADKVYMAPISSWFFTHFGKEVPWSKNWLFKSENLWKDRWDQVLKLGDKLSYLEIITWNDYGESHNVRHWGGNHSDDGSSKWSEGLDHSAMLDLSLPYIKAWKQGKKQPIIEKDQVIYWYRPHLKSAECDNTDNFGSKPNGWDIVADTVFVTTMTKLGGTVKITSGNKRPVLKLVPPGVHSLEIPMGAGKQQFEFFTLTGGYKKGIATVDITDTCWVTDHYPEGPIYNYNYHSGVLNC